MSATAVMTETVSGLPRHVTGYQQYYGHSPEVAAAAARYLPEALLMSRDYGVIRRNMATSRSDDFAEKFPAVSVKEEARSPQSSELPDFSHIRATWQPKPEVRSPSQSPPDAARWRSNNDYFRSPYDDYVTKRSDAPRNYETVQSRFSSDVAALKFPSPQTGGFSSGFPSSTGAGLDSSLEKLARFSLEMTGSGPLASLIQRYGTPVDAARGARSPPRLSGGETERCYPGGESDELASPAGTSSGQQAAYPGTATPVHSAGQTRKESPVYCCHICPYVGGSEAEYSQHMDGHFEHRCPHCTYSSRTEGRLKRHIKDFHGHASTETTPTSTSDPSDTRPNTLTRPTSNQPKLIKCRQCKFSTKVREEFWEHSRVHIRKEKMLACPKCPFVTEFKHHLEYHLRNHLGSKPFQCPRCNYACVNRSMLNSHAKSHTNVYQYRCADCVYATKYCHSLKLHLRKHGHRPATVLNPDGSLPTDGSGDFDLVSRRGPPRGPRRARTQSRQKTAVSSSTGGSSGGGNTESQKFENYYGAPSMAPFGRAFEQDRKWLEESRVGPDGVDSCSGAWVSAGSAPRNFPRLESPGMSSGVKMSSPLSGHVLPNGFAGASDVSGGYPGEAVTPLSPPCGGLIDCSSCPFVATSYSELAMHCIRAHTSPQHAPPSPPSPKFSPDADSDNTGFSPVGGHFFQKYDSGDTVARCVVADSKEGTVTRFKGVDNRCLPVRKRLYDATLAMETASSDQERVECPLDLTAKVKDDARCLGSADDDASMSMESFEMRDAEREPSSTMMMQSAGSRKRSRKSKAFKVTVAADQSDGELSRDSDLWPAIGGQFSPPQSPSAASAMSGGKSRSSAAGSPDTAPTVRDDISDEVTCTSPTNGSEVSEREQNSMDSADMVNEAGKSGAGGKSYYECSHCRIGFLDVVTYKLHASYHGYRDPFQCGLCGHQCSDPVDFFVHIARVAHQ